MQYLNLRELRKSLGKTQNEFATDLGLSQAYISLLEDSDKPISEELLKKINDKYNLHNKGITIVHNTNNNQGNNNVHGTNNIKGNNTSNSGGISKAEADAFKEIMSLQKELIESLRQQLHECKNK